MGGKEQTGAHHLTGKWIILSLVAAILAVSLAVVLLLFATCLAEQTSKLLAESRREALRGRVNDRVSVLVNMNESTFALANAIRLTETYTFSEVGEKIAPRLFTAFSMIQLVSQVSYIDKNGLVFSYHRDNRTNGVFPINFTSCHLYNQITDQYSGERYGYPVALRYRQCFATKGWFLEVLNGQVGIATINNQTIFFTAPVGNLGVVSIGVDFKDFVRHVSEIGLDQSHLFITINGSSESQIPVSSSQSVDSLNDMDSSYLVGSNAKIVEHLSSTENISMQIRIPRVPMVITLAFPDNKTMKTFQVLKVIIVFLAVALLFCISSFTFFMLRRLKRSKIQAAILQADLIKQKEAVQQAERKSMNKSMAFARASHDVRNALHSIIELSKISRDQTTPNSELRTNLTKMMDYATDLLDILNTILDTSKVESGKMHLEQVEFNIPDIIEKSVDIFNVLAEKKGLEMIWDPCDFSILKLGKVIGDRQRFKQILDNLLSNAIKFTSEGKIVVRAWASKPKMKISNITADYGCSISHMFFCISRSVLRYSGSKIMQQDLHAMQNDPLSIDLTLEVDDTGIGIPIEKRASVFENYVQVKEDSPEGTGLGLGIVQSFVRLMGGEISIQDKEPGEKGTCFKFNILLKLEEAAFQETSRCGEANQSTISEPFMLNNSHNVKVHSLLCVKGCETKRILQTWIENLGIKVWAANQAEHISPTLEKIKNSINSSTKADSVLLCRTFSWKAKGVENEEFLHRNTPESLPRAGMCSEFPLRILVIVDLSNGNSMEIISTLIEFFRGNTNLYCKIVCIADSKVTEKDMSEFGALPCDLTLRKPIHGSRLHKLFKVIEELQKTEELYVDRIKTSPFAKPQTEKQPAKPCEITEETSPLAKLQTETKPEKPCEITEETSSTVENKNSLRGKSMLLVDDNGVMRSVGSSTLSNLGAEVEVAKDGLEALNLVKKSIETGLAKGKCGDYFMTYGYDAIFMDCQMPVMDGYEAARQIRNEERRCGIHIPIIALSADKTDEDLRKALAAGMDHYLVKPLNKDKVFDLFKLARS